MTVSGGGLEALFYRGPITAGNIAAWLTSGVLKDGGAGGVTIGLTTITSGTDTRVLFDDAGTIGENAGFTFDKTNQALTLTSVANPAASTLTLTGGTALTTSQPVLNMTQTWNAAVTFTAIKLNVTSTSSNAASLLMDLQVASTSKFNVDKTGGITGPSSAYSINQFGNGTFGSNSVLLNSSGVTNFNGGNLAWSSTSGSNGSVDLTVYRDGPDIIAQRRTTNAQTHRWYESYTDAGNNGYTEIALVSSVWTWRTAKNGTGTVREMAITPSTKLTINGSAVIGSAAIATNATDGFLYIPTCAGTPTGTPTAQTGTVAMVYDTTNNKLYVYNGAWKGGTAPGAWS